MRSILVLVMVVALLGLSLGCRKGASVQNIQANTMTTASGERLQAQDVRKAILSACAFRGWQAREISSGLIEATLLVRGKHTVVVDIPYSAEKYAINYKSSNNMEYKSSSNSIHPNYNKWVNTLYMDINSQLVKQRS